MPAFDDEAASAAEAKNSRLQITALSAALTKLDLCKGLPSDTKSFIKQALQTSSTDMLSKSTKPLEALTEQARSLQRTTTLEQSILLLAAMQGSETFCKVATLLFQPVAPQQPPSAQSWLPRGVRDLKPLNLVIPEHCETFSDALIHNMFKGSEWSPGFYFDQDGRHDLLKGRGYWMIDQQFEPFAPSAPGMHGAKLTAPLRDSDDDEAPEVYDYNDTPVFIRLAGQKEYTYMGTYSQNRYSDRVDYDTMERIPDAVLQYWATELTKADRPQWVTDALMTQFFPVSSLVIGDDMSENELREASISHGVHAHEAQQEAKMMIAHLTPESILNAFTRADFDAEPGLRLCWEYFNCTGWDKDFYASLCIRKHNAEEPTSKDDSQVTGTVDAKKASPTQAINIKVNNAPPGFLPPHLRGKKSA